MVERRTINEMVQQELSVRDGAWVESWVEACFRQSSHQLPKSELNFECSDKDYSKIIIRTIYTMKKRKAFKYNTELF